MLITEIGVMMEKKPEVKPAEGAVAPSNSPPGSRPRPFGADARGTRGRSGARQLAVTVRIDQGQRVVIGAERGRPDHRASEISQTAKNAMKVEVDALCPGLQSTVR